MAENILEKYCTDFTQLARSNKLDPVIGRDNEIRRVMQVLSRRTKNNPVLIGEPGVGKTAIIEGLAQRIINGDVPTSLLNKRLLGLEISSVIAGAKYRGEFEERFKQIIEEVTKSEGQIIIFIDELHTLVGAGAAEGSVDAGNMLKPGLARGTIRLIGATTLDEYRMHIEKDAALERRFQPVIVNPPSVTDTISILRGIKEKYELHHGIRISDDAIVSAAELSDRYISDRFLPDKAIDLIDEASSMLKIDSESEPELIDRINRQITQIEIELKALKKDSSQNAETINLLESKKTQLTAENKVLTERWVKQKKLLEEIQAVKSKIDNKKSELEKAERQINLDIAAKIKYGEIPELKKQLDTYEANWSKIPESDRLLKTEVTENDISAVVSKWTGIPITKLLKSEITKLKDLESELKKRVVGQDEALTAVANSIRRSRVGLADENRPMASFLFLGPTGVGKTETAKALAEFLFSTDKSLVRIDMSEYSESHSIARLIGAPPGYIGYEEGGQLTELVRRKPYSVILLDEIEKAHPKIFTLFLQIFDEGRLTDGQGRTVNFKNTILIMTSNLGAKIINENIDLKPELIKEKVWKLVESTFPAEFINRLDQIILFEALKLKEIIDIVNLQIGKIATKLKEQKIDLELLPNVIEHLAKIGYDLIYGARPIKRLIQSEILDQIALMILNSETKIQD